jgi:hypothetical protein
MIEDSRSVERPCYGVSGGWPRRPDCRFWRDCGRGLIHDPIRLTLHDWTASSYHDHHGRGAEGGRHTIVTPADYLAQLPALDL